MNAITIDKTVLLLAGTMNLVRVTLSVTVPGWWALLPAFVSVSLTQSSVTGFCPAAALLKRLGMKSGPAF